MSTTSNEHGKHGSQRHAGADRKLRELEKEFESIMQNPEQGKVPALVRSVLEILNLNASGLATRLSVSPATVARWAGGTTPHVREIRAMQELVRARFAEPHQIVGVSFFGRTIGIWRFDEFFERAVSAKRVFVLKNWMGFQAGMNPRIKGALKALFAQNKHLQICYAFLKASEAATTFRNFHTEVAREFPENIKWAELTSAERPMQMLGDVFASPFILEYPDERIDVLLEMPVRVLEPMDENDLSGFTTILAELPDLQKHRLWAEWKEELFERFRD
jgi:hypothetical protein